MKEKLTPFLAFLIILFSMPLGHAAMILMEHYLSDSALILGAFLLGLAGAVITVVGGLINKEKENLPTTLGFIGALFLWTGWIEFGYVYFAKRYNVAPLIVNGEVATKPEYLLLMSSIGFLAIIMMYYIFNVKSRCSFFNWIQRVFKIRNVQTNNFEKRRNFSMITFMETNIILWACYLLLMFAYDDKILGEYHPVTIIIAFGSLIWAIFLFRNLLKIKRLGAAIRYAIPTVIIFWNFVEILGRWGLFEEIWVNPLKYKFEMLGIAIACIIPIIYFLTHKNNNNKLTN